MGSIPVGASDFFFAHTRDVINMTSLFSSQRCDPLGSWRDKELMTKLFYSLTAFMTFDTVPESHMYKNTTFQAQNPGRFLSCMRKEMALLMFSLPAGIIVRGYEDRVVILLLFWLFDFSTLFLSFRAVPYC